MKVLISGTSKGIGKAIAKYFLKQGHEVYGLDVLKASIKNDKYHHYICDISKDKLPDIKDINILINNAGVQDSNDIDVNLIGTIRVTKKYAFQKQIKSVLFNASASARSGFEFPEYVASKAGVVGYMKNVASELAKKYHAPVNAISLGGVITESNKPVMDDKQSWKKIMDATPMKKWMSLDEVCEWVYFLTVTNKSMTGQDILIDNGELNLNNTFVWPK